MRSGEGLLALLGVIVIAILVIGCLEGMWARGDARAAQAEAQAVTARIVACEARVYASEERRMRGDVEAVMERVAACEVRVYGGEMRREAIAGAVQLLLEERAEEQGRGRR